MNKPREIAIGQVWQFENDGEFWLVEKIDETKKHVQIKKIKRTKGGLGSALGYRNESYSLETLANSFAWKCVSNGSSIWRILYG